MRRVKNKKSLGHKIYFTLLLLIFLFGCATPEKYDAELAGWVGKSENKLIAESFRVLFVQSLFFAGRRFRICPV